MDRSSIVDVPYALLSTLLASDNTHGYSIEHIGELLKERASTIKRCYNPFGSPSPESRKKVESGTVKLSDGYEIKLETSDKKYVIAISERLGVDECDAVVLFRSFLYNEGLPPASAEASIDELVEELIAQITPFYFEERLSLLRVLIPLLRARSNPRDPLCELSKFLEELFPSIADKETFLKNILTQYRRRAEQELSPSVLADPRRAATVARQAIREQLLMLELVFWIQWDFVHCGDDQVLELWQLGSSVGLGLSHKHSQLLLDAEANRLLEDLAAIWVLVCIESLNLEPAAGVGRDVGEGLLGQEAITQLNGLAARHQHEWIWAPLIASLALLPSGSIDTFVSQPSPFATLNKLMSTSVLSTTIAWGSASPLCEPSALGYRSVMRGFLIRALTQLTIEDLPDPLPSELQTLWERVFGDAEAATVAPLVRQFWEWDYKAAPSPLDTGSGRKGLLEIVRMRFPLQLSLIRLLGVMSGAGIETDYGFQIIEDDRIVCANYVYHYMIQLPTLALFIPANSELSTIIQKRSDKMHTTLRAVSLAGAGVIPPNSLGILLGEGADGSKVVLFEHKWSGWRFLGEILRGYVQAKTSAGRVGVGRERRLNLATRRGTVWECTAEDLLSGGGQGITEDDISDIFDLVRHVGSSLTEGGRLVDLVQSLEHDPSDGSKTGADVVELATLILEDSLKKTSQSARRLVGACLGFIATLLTPGSILASRVWLYLRNSTLFVATSHRSRTQTSGTYPTTMAVLRLISRLVSEQLGSLGTTSVQEEELKSEVLLKALSYIHHGLWIEHRRWRYDRISEKYEIGTLMVSAYTDVLQYGSSQLRSFVLGLFDASKSTDFGWLVEVLATGKGDIDSLFKARRYADARSFIRHLESLLDFFRTLLHASPGKGLDSMLCETLQVSRPNSGDQVTVEPVSTLAAYSEARELGPAIPLGSLKLLSTLAASEQRVYGHLTDPEGSVRAWVRLAGHPFDDMPLRVAAWDFASKCALHQPALRKMFVDGQVSMPNAAATSTGKGTLMTSALDILQTAKELWESNPQLLSSVITFIDAVNRSATPLQQFDDNFWANTSFLCCEDLGPAPVPDAAIGPYCYRAAVKSKSLHILATELERSPQNEGRGKPKPAYQKTVDQLFSNEEQLTDHFLEALSTSFDPQLHHTAMARLEQTFPTIHVNSIGLQSRHQDREFGDNYLYQVHALRGQLTSLKNVDDLYLQSQGNEVVKATVAVNLNWSLADAQMLLTKAWKTILIVGAPYIKGKLANVSPKLNSLASTLLNTIGSESRSGPVMTVVHAERLQVLLALFELIWFDSFDDSKDPKPLVRMMSSLTSIINSETFPPEDSLRGLTTPGYHHLIFQTIFYLGRRCQKLLQGSEVSAGDRLSIVRSVHSAMTLTISSLKYTFDAASPVPRPAVASDLKLLTSIFVQCASPRIGLPSAVWCQTCREIGLTGSSLVLLSQGESTLVPEILLFHSTLASASESAAQLVNEGAMSMYSRLSPSLASELWCTTVSIVTTLLSTLGYSHNFVELEVCAFVQAHGGRIADNLRWTIEMPIVKSTFAEIERVTELFYVLSKASKPFFGQHGLSAQILQAFTPPALDLLQQFTYLFTHPNHLSSLIDPDSEKEIQIMSVELPKGSSCTLSDLFDIKTRPVTFSYLSTLAEAATTLIMALMVIGGAGKVLSSYEGEWNDEVFPLLSPHAKVVLGEPSSLGTVVQLAGAINDALRGVTAVGGSSENLNARPSSILQCLLETALTFAATQIVACTRHPRAIPDHFPDAEADDFGRQSNSRDSTLNKSLNRKSRLGRTVTGEIAADFLTLLTSVQGTLEKRGIGKRANMATFLRGFLEERI